MASSAKKIQSLPRLKSLLRLLKKSGKKVVFTNGTFDILHLGHVTYLEKAKSAGDILVIGVNSDRSVKTYKSPQRPLNPEKDRLRVLAALGCVDYVTLFEEPTPLEVIQELRPDILVKGADWKKREIAGAADVESWGGRVLRIPLVSGRSSTRMIEMLNTKP
ncbi:MAG: D-glycero-beta-D-manno-heptose 1-phosphate adenylyltransferase [Candidatus Omnitrophica bacterium]|nr:D-glycero-beta-D-manno-heptose 1-phosphate adenylyltransferase [Candidatus Omnitrophota bacterium]